MQAVIAATTAAAAGEATAPEMPRLPPSRSVRTDGRDARTDLLVPEDHHQGATLRSPHRAGKDTGWLQTIFGIGPEIHGAYVRASSRNT